MAAVRDSAKPADRIPIIALTGVADHQMYRTYCVLVPNALAIHETSVAIPMG